MGYSDSFATKSDAKLSAISAAVDARRSVNRAAHFGHEDPDLGRTLRATDRRAAVQYCIRNDLI